VQYIQVISFSMYLQWSQKRFWTLMSHR